MAWQIEGHHNADKKIGNIMYLQSTTEKIFLFAEPSIHG